MPTLAYASASYLMNRHFWEHLLLKCYHSINTALKFWYFLLQQKRNIAWVKKHLEFTWNNEVLYYYHMKSRQWNNCNEQRLKTELLLTYPYVTQDEKIAHSYAKKLTRNVLAISSWFFLHCTCSTLLFKFSSFLLKKSLFKISIRSPIISLIYNKEKLCFKSKNLKTSTWLYKHSAKFKI